MRKIIYLLMAILILSGCEIKDKVYSRDLEYMDTYINIKIYGNDDKFIADTMDKVNDIYGEYDKLCDRYQAYDNIVNISYINNELGINEEQKIDEKLYEILEYSKSYYNETDKLFNIALGNVIDVWAKYRNGEKTGIPTLSELQNSGSIDLDTLILMDNNTIKKTSNISLDLGGIAKGYTTEKVGEYLESIGLDKYLITAGTSSVKVGKHYNYNKYKIGLLNPEDGITQYKVLSGNNISITTSGSYIRFYEYEGVRYHHIIDPNTLFPTNHVLAVTVITNDASLGEILSKVLFLKPINEGLEYIKNYENTQVLWYGINGQIITSDGMKNYE